MNPRSLRLSKLIFYSLIVCLPINSGLHFVSSSAYVGGLLVDYLIPTLFAQDILAILLCIAWVIENPSGVLDVIKSKKAFALVLLIYVLFLSTLLATRFIPSFYAFFRWVVYALVCLYIQKNFDRETDTVFVSKALSYWLVFLGILALGQYIKQGAFFNNYLILGEQPYSAATPLIDRENIFGVARVPAYGIFRHPNIFGGFLAVALIWVLNAYRKKFVSATLFITSFLSGLLGLVLTFSYFSWTAALLGTALLLAESKKHFRTLLILIFITTSLCGLLINKIPFPSYLLENPSVYKRVELLEAGYRAISAENYTFGTGINSSTVFIERFLEPSSYLRFVQPPHNVFVLLASEVGIVGLALFLIIFVNALVQSKQKNFFIFVTLLQILFLSSFDHYFVTIHQPFLLLWLTLGLAI